MHCIKIVILLFCFFSVTGLFAQDSTKVITPVIKDSAIAIKADSTIILKDSILKPKHDPHKATIRSAIIPGWGQAYNKEYWKIPIVYAAIGIPVGLYIYNNNWYHRTKTAYEIVLDNDTAHFSEINPRLANLSALDLQYYRNQFRRDRDYSVLYFLIMYGLNVVDATVFGHLKNFDVSDDLSLHLNPQYNPLTKTAGVGLVFNFKNTQHKPLTIK